MFEITTKPNTKCKKELKKKRFVEIVVMHSPKFVTDTKLRLQKAQRTLPSINTKLHTHKHRNLGMSYSNIEQNIGEIFFLNIYYK